MSSPYDEIPDYQRWSSVERDIAAGIHDVQGPTRFSIAATDTISSAGSCFAARLATDLRQTARYYIAEPPPSWLDDEGARVNGYLPFSARYGLVFSCIQLLQLFERAFGTFVPESTSWKFQDRYVDPFRPRISPHGYRTEGAMLADRTDHLRAVRRMFESVNVFVFTLGLTEAWRDRRDGAVFPFCPGVAGGELAPEIHEFVNYSVMENVTALDRFVRALRNINPTIRIILSVSPVPLGATIERQHVVRSTVYSKSNLRVTAEEIYRAHECVEYFPAYELVSQTFFRNDPFLPDRRHLQPAAVERVLAAFRSAFLNDVTPGQMRRANAAESIVDRTPEACDEDILAR